MEKVEGEEVWGNWPQYKICEIQQHHRQLGAQAFISPCDLQEDLGLVEDTGEATLKISELRKR